MNEREAIRREKLWERAALTERERDSYSKIIQSAALTLVQNASPKAVHCYLSMRTEVQTADLIEALMELNIAVAVPVVEKGNPVLNHSMLASSSSLVAGSHGTQHPKTLVPIDLNEIELAFVPLSAFDRAGNRLGYGKGYYDRFLSRLPNARIIGLAFSCQEAAIPAERHDVPLDVVITEHEVITMSTGLRLITL